MGWAPWRGGGYLPGPRKETTTRRNVTQGRTFPPSNESLGKGTPVLFPVCAVLLPGTPTRYVKGWWYSGTDLRFSPISEVKAHYVASVPRWETPGTLRGKRLQHTGPARPEQTHAAGVVQPFGPAPPSGASIRLQVAGPPPPPPHRVVPTAIPSICPHHRSS